MPNDDLPWWLRTAPVTRTGFGAAEYADVWLGTEYPAGRGQLRSGWRCPGCQRCHSPSVLTCRWCEPKEPESCCGPAGCEEAER